MEPTLSEEEESQKIQEQFDEICIELNVDQKIADIAWRGYEAVRKQCMLEGSQVPWLACSVYVASWLCPPQTLSSSNGQKAAPLVIIDKCGLSIIDFFEKLQKWVDMASMSRKFQDQVMRMESCFAVASVVFKKFEPILNDMFVNANLIREGTPEKVTKSTRGRCVKSSQLTFFDIKQFCWTLFIYIKRSSLGLQDDLIRSYHLLLCCLDLMYVNVVALKRHDLIQKDFASKITEDDNSLIEYLCTSYDGIVLDAKQMRIHWFRARLRTLITEKVVKGDIESQIGLMSANNYDFNLKSMQDHYEKLIMKKGDMDERVFLPRIKTEQLRSPPTKIRKVESDIDEDTGETEKEMMLRRNVEACLDRVSQYHVPTPLTGRRYLDKDLFCPITPVSSLHSASKLQLMLADAVLGPTQELRNLLWVYKPDPLVVIVKTMGTMSESFLAACTQDTENVDSHEESLHEFGNQRREMAEMLYYRILEKIVRSEKEKASLDDLCHVLNQEIFHRALIACCFELVLFSFNSGKTFPWILKVFNIHAFHFYKVIELVIRPEPELTREMVKHLNHIEERVLEELAWTPDSPLWVALASNRVPTCEEVALPQPINKLVSVQSVLAGNLRQNFAGGSPLGTVGRFQSPVKTPQGPTKRRLDFESEKATGGPVKVSTISIRGAQNVGAPSDHTITISSIHLPSSTSGVPTQSVRLEKKVPGGGADEQNKLPVQPTKLNSGSLALFFRKVYYLTSLRLHDLCERVRANDNIRQNAWTIFDYVLSSHTNLMKGRHVDQLLMCSLYIVTKVRKHVVEFRLMCLFYRSIYFPVTKFDISFHDIMSNYRSQPQAKSRVYRNVLLGSKPSSPTEDMESSRDSNSGNADESRPKLRSGSTLPIPTASSAPPTPTPVEDEYGDLIKFYNAIFVLKVEEFAKKFATNDENGGKRDPTSIQLSPLPNVKSQALSQRRRILDGIFVSPMKANSFPLSPARPLRYSFSRSPAKDLRAINNMLKGSEARNSRFLNINHGHVLRRGAYVTDPIHGGGAASGQGPTNQLNRRYMESSNQMEDDA